MCRGPGKPGGSWPSTPFSPASPQPLCSSLAARLPYRASPCLQRLPPPPQTRDTAEPPTPRAADPAPGLPSAGGACLTGARPGLGWSLGKRRWRRKITLPVVWLKLLVWREAGHRSGVDVGQRQVWSPAGLHPGPGDLRRLLSRSDLRSCGRVEDRLSWPHRAMGPTRCSLC